MMLSVEAVVTGLPVQRPLFLHSPDRPRHARDRGAQDRHVGQLTAGVAVNLFAIITDVTPSSRVGTVIGVAALCGNLSGMVVLRVAGELHR
jgi:hypothetical protein